MASLNLMSDDGIHDVVYIVLYSMTDSCLVGQSPHAPATLPLIQGLLYIIYSIRKPG